MEQKLIRQIKTLQIYAGLLTVAVILLGLLHVLQANRTPHFKELDAERINIVEQDGKLRMVISNQKEQHSGAMDGKNLSHRERPAGMIFFNDEGDECGGLIFDGSRKGASMTYSIDQYKNDQIMQLQYSQDKDSRAYGFKLWDRPDDFTLSQLIQTVDSLNQLHDSVAYNSGLAKLKAGGQLGSERLYLGKSDDNQVGLRIKDKKGRTRIRLGLDSTNNIVFQAFDSTGRPVPLGAH
jgi:hypothetical protein